MNNDDSYSSVFLRAFQEDLNPMRLWHWALHSSYSIAADKQALVPICQLQPQPFSTGHQPFDRLAAKPNSSCLGLLVCLLVVGHVPDRQAMANSFIGRSWGRFETQRERDGDKEHCNINLHLAKCQLCPVSCSSKHGKDCYGLLPAADGLDTCWLGLG